MKDKKQSISQNSIDWPNQFFNFFGVLVGVLFAFTLNSWNESRKSERQAMIALQNIKKEITNNLEDLEKSVLVNVRQKEFLDLYLPVVDESLDINLDQDSLNTAFADYLDIYNAESNQVSLNFDLHALSSVAWEAALRANSLSELDYNLALVMQEHYTVQEKLDQIDDALIEEVRKNDNSKLAMQRLRTALRIGNEIAKTMIEKTGPGAVDGIEMFLDSQ